MGSGCLRVGVIMNAYLSMQKKKSFFSSVIPGQHLGPLLKQSYEWSGNGAKTLDEAEVETSVIFEAP